MAATRADERVPLMLHSPKQIYRYHERLYTHLMQADHQPGHRGIFLAGDDVSWTGGWTGGLAGGWADGAVTTGLNAVRGAHGNSISMASVVKS